MCLYFKQIIYRVLIKYIKKKVENNKLIKMKINHKERFIMITVHLPVFFLIMCQLFKKNTRMRNTYRKKLR